MSLLIPDPANDRKVIVFTFGEDPDHVLVHVQHAIESPGDAEAKLIVDSVRMPPVQVCHLVEQLVDWLDARGFDEEVLRRWESFREWVRLMRVDPLD